MTGRVFLLVRPNVRGEFSVYVPHIHAFQGAMSQCRGRLELAFMTIFNTVTQCDSHLLKVPLQYL